LDKVENISIKLKIIHPFVQLDQAMVWLQKNSLEDLIRIVSKKIDNKYGRYNRKNKRWISPLQGCIVLKNNVMVGFFDGSKFKMLNGADNKLKNLDEVVIMLPVSGG
jgi:molybdopterin converting factor small subunit